MKYVAKEYQKEATKRIVENDACGLFLDMGMGKSAATLAAIDELVLDRVEISKVLIIAPLRVAKTTWLDERNKWDDFKHLKLVRVLGSAVQRKKALEEKAHIYVINRENVDWLVKLKGKKWDFDMVVIDELSSFKNRKSKRWKALRSIRSGVKKMVALTGTPVANSLLDLWAEMYLLDQGVALGRSFRSFTDRYFVPETGDGRVVWTWSPKKNALPNILQRIAPICVSMSKEDWLNMPDMIGNKVNVALDDSSWDTYETFEKERLLTFDEGDVEAESAAGVTQKLLQLCGGAMYNDRNSFQVIHNFKLDALEEIYEVMQGEPLLVYYGFKHELERLQTRFPEGRTLKTEQDIQDWNAKKIPILFAHPASVGHGLNLQDGGHTIVWYTLSYSLELYQQANARLHRQGQTEKVIVHHLMVPDSIDESVCEALEKKDLTQATLLHALRHRVERVKQKELKLVS
nr:DEAD/DEAH box helicase [Burkholderiaceae bacterium]